MKIESLPKLPNPPPKPSAADDKAVAEGEGFGSGEDLGEIAAANQHGRREQVLDLVLRFVKLGLWIGAVFLLIAVSLWFYHIFAPPCWFTWLSPEKLSTIENTIFKVGLGAIFGFLVKSKFV